MVIKSKFTYKSDMDGLTIHALRYEPEGEIKGIIQIVHGMCEHKERYTSLMDFLASRGYLCVIHDHRGHGQSIKDKSDLGYMYEAGWRGLVEDTHQLT
ncbi:MAG: alpha/beta hydrolase, partial [Lachnospiraceae bacterium]|nr:alpha/beta hydrolase [Lachnospiraceae bacterium]